MTRPGEGGAGGRLRGGRGSLVPDAVAGEYAVGAKVPVWTWEVPTYFAVGAVAAGSSLLAWASGRVGDEGLARLARRNAAIAAALCPPLLVSDLGRPERFLNMLRVVRWTSPLNVGSWVLTAYAPSAIGAALLGSRRRSGRVAGRVAAGLAPVMATYTAVLVANTAHPVWHEARRELPWVFAAGALGGGGAAAVVAGASPGSAAHRLAAVGSAAAVGTGAVMERRLGRAGAPYQRGRARRLGRWAVALLSGGAILVGSRTPVVARLGGAVVLGGVMAERWSVFEAGRDREG